MSSLEETDEQIVNGVNVTERVAQINDQGYTVIEDFISPEEIATIRKAFDTEVPMTEMRAIGVTTGNTMRAHNLLGKTRAVDYLFLDERLRALVDSVLGMPSQVNVTTLFNVLPGEEKMLLHPDDGLWPIPRPHPRFLCNALIALDESDEENGATHLVPYSHKWNDEQIQAAMKDPDSAESIQVPCKAGTMVMWDGSMLHGGGANTSKDRERLGFFMSHVVFYLRPQEIQLVSVPREVAREMPRKLQRLLGYHRFGLGVDGRDPIDVLNDGIVVHESAKVGWRP
jgi:ectoine hydroxylase-related dioxygenase (phytanoyl-CoA dioxygenase family)